MRSVALCYHPSDSGTALELRSYLEANCSLAIEDGVLPMDGDLLNAIETGLSLDIVLVLLSADSVRTPWPRDRWESILLQQAQELNTRIVYILLSDCRFPAVLKKERFFDLSTDFVTGRRAVKRWLIADLFPARPAPNLPAKPQGTVDTESLETLADWPDLVSCPNKNEALAFAHARASDFETVAWIYGERRGPAGILGDIAYALGLELTGPWQDNASALREYSGAHRILLCVENPNPAIVDLIHFGGRASLLLVETDEEKPCAPLSELVRLFSSWSRNADACLHALADVETRLDSPDILKDENWPAACALCHAAVALLKEYHRRAEAYDLLARLSSATQLRGDFAAKGHLDWEASWILEAWDQPAVHVPASVAAAMGEATQLSLF